MRYFNGFPVSGTGRRLWRVKGGGNGAVKIDAHHVTQARGHVPPFCHYAQTPKTAKQDKTQQHF
jgi:hypothetical protein